MTSHELAGQLLELPDLPVTCESGSDPSDECEVTEMRVMPEGRGPSYYFDSETRRQHGRRIYLS